MIEIQEHNASVMQQKVTQSGCIYVIKCWVSQDGCHININPKMDVRQYKIEKTKKLPQGEYTMQRIKTEKVV